MNMAQITIWNRFIQALVSSNDKSSIKLAFHLVSDRGSLVHWYILNEQECEECNLPHIKGGNQIGVIYDDYLYWPSICKDRTYIKRLYDNYMG